MAEDVSPTWRVLTWNIRGWARPAVAEVGKVITGLRPDVAIVEEIQRRQVHRLAAALGWRFAWTRKHYPYSPLMWWRAEGLAILTPHAIGGVWRQTISPGVGTWTYRHRVLLAATVTRDDERLRVYGTHLAAHSEADERIAQARRVAERVAHDDAALRVVAGDLNADQEVEVIRELHAVGLRDPGSDWTHPAHAPRKRYDYVLVPDDARVVESYVPDGGDHWAELSDHLPLLVEFARP